MILLAISDSFSIVINLGAVINDLSDKVKSSLPLPLEYKQGVDKCNKQSAKLELYSAELRIFLQTAVEKREKAVSLGVDYKTLDI